MSADAGRTDGSDGISAFETIGVLGGLSPQATIDFEARLHRVAQRLISQRHHGGYPPMVVYDHRHPPILVKEDLSPRSTIEPDPRLLDAARIERAASREVLSMIDVTLAEVRRRKWRKVGVLGFGDPIVYTRPLEWLNIGAETIDGALRARLDAEIVKVMEGRNGPESAGIAREAVGVLRGRGVNGVILACTELALLLDAAARHPDVLDPAALLADSPAYESSTWPR